MNDDDETKMSEKGGGKPQGKNSKLLYLKRKITMLFEGKKYQDQSMNFVH